jgi:hypothetical protein
MVLARLRLCVKDGAYTRPTLNGIVPILAETEAASNAHIALHKNSSSLVPLHILQTARHLGTPLLDSVRKAFAMRLIAIRYLVIALGSVIAWLVAGRPLAMILDHLITIPSASVPVNSVEYDGGAFLIDKLSMTFGGINNLRSDLALQSDAQNRVVLSTGGRSFIFGPRTNPVDSSGRPEIDFAVEPGDEVLLGASRSLVGWPTPFEFNIMMRSPWWKRYVYYRLTWNERSGARLAIYWRYEQYYYMSGGWTAPAMMWNGETGLLRVEIQPGASLP